jgi:hypothetical protein
VSLKPKILIAYESTKPELKACAERVKKAADSLSYRSVVKCAEDVTIPEILAAQAYVFGASFPLSDEFREIERVLRGINLAGRRCGLFSDGEPKAVDFLRAMSTDSELKLYKDSLDYSRVSDEEAVLAWLRAALS